MQEKNNQIVPFEGLDSLSENEKLELFKVEELENRLEMAALSGSGGSLISTNINGLCW